MIMLCDKYWYKGNHVTIYKCKYQSNMVCILNLYNVIGQIYSIRKKKKKD